MEVECKDEGAVSGEELYRRFLTGDNEAFEKLVGLYEHELALFINGIVRDYYEAKQLMIETFAQLAVGGSRFAGKSSLKTYLFAIGRNLALRYIKMRDRERHIPYEDSIETLIGSGETPEAVMEREECRQYLQEAMRSLKEEYRVVLELLYFDEMSYLEAGRIMKKNEKQISNLAYRAKSALKKELAKGGRKSFAF